MVFVLLTTLSWVKVAILWLKKSVLMKVINIYIYIYIDQRGIAPVIIFALVEKQSRIIKQRKKLKKKKRRAKTSEGKDLESKADKEIEMAAFGSRAKWETCNVTKFMEHPVSIEKLAIEIQTLDFA